MTLPILELAGLRKSFGELEILTGIDLKVTKGELAFVIGPSGSGKSTMLRCCNLLERPTSGAVLSGATAPSASNQSSNFP